MPGEVKPPRPGPVAAAKAVVKTRRAGHRRDMYALGTFMLLSFALTAGVTLAVQPMVSSHLATNTGALVLLLLFSGCVSGGIAALLFDQRRWAAEVVFAGSATGMVFDLLAPLAVVTRADTALRSSSLGDVLHLLKWSVDQFGFFPYVLGSVTCLIGVVLSYCCHRSGRRLDDADADLRRKSARYPDEG